MLKLSICIVAYNEEKYLPNLIEDMSNQKYEHEYMEIVLIDSMSTDRTLDIMKKFKEENSNFYSVQVLINENRIQAAGWNVAITSATGDVIARIDAHTKIPPEYSEYVMKEIYSGEDIVGGMRPCIIENDTGWGHMLLQTENSLFGSSVNASRRSYEKQYVKTMFHAAYRREVFDIVGLFNEKLLRTEDNEMHYRMRKAGYRLCYNPKIVTYQYSRSSLKKMIKQKYANGYWIGLTLKICPGCISIYHLVPGAFLIGIILTSILAGFGCWQCMVCMWGLYAIFSLYSTVAAITANGFHCFHIVMPVLYLILHICYGMGTVFGILNSLLRCK